MNRILTYACIAVGTIATPLGDVASRQTAHAQNREAPATGADIAAFANKVQADEHSVRLELRPQAAPIPALRYNLMPPLAERKPGNAAIYYFKAGVNFESKALDEFYDKHEDIYEWRWDEVPKEEVRQLLETYRVALETVEQGTRRDHCEWQLPLGEQNLMTVLLPEVQLCRTYCRLLNLKARLHIADGDFDGALHVLHSNFALARHVGEGPTMINSLVGIAIGAETIATLHDLIQAPGAPNLYWALSRLPRPFVDMQQAMEVEREFLYLSYPRLRDVEKSDRTPEEWDAALSDLLEVLRLAGAAIGQPQDPTVKLAVGVRGYPIAKQRLIESGMSTDDVEKMPVAQVLVIEILRTYDELRDDVFRWTMLPYVEAEPFFRQADRDLAVEGRRKEILPLASLLLPAVRAASAAVARSERSIAALRTVEAIRLHAAANGGRPPAKLEDIKAVPVPSDPVTGKPFDYSATEDSAVITVSKSGQHLDIGFPYTLHFSSN